MTKIRKVSENPIALNFNCTEQNFVLYWNSFLESSLGYIYKSIPWQKITNYLQLKNSNLGRDATFSPQGKIALMFLKSYTGLSDRLLIENLNANYEYQFFCDIQISPKNKIENYKIVSDIRVELSRKLNIEDLQKILADYWSPYMENTNCVLQDATCFESYLRYPTDVKLLWESCDWIYKQLTNLCKTFKIKKPRSKFKEQSIKQLIYNRKRKKTYKKTQKRIRSLLYLLDKLLCQLSEIQEKIGEQLSCSKLFYKRLKTIKEILKQQIELFNGNKIKGRIVSISKDYVRPIVRGKEKKRVEFGAKANIIQIDKIDFIEQISFDAFNEGTHYEKAVKLTEKLFEKPVKISGADAIYATNKNRTFSTKNKILTGFVPKGNKGKNETSLKKTRQIINNKRATVMEGAFGKQKNHYNLDCIKARTKETEILWIFFGIHTANAVEISKRIKQAENQACKTA